MIDLHTHSLLSDGELLPVELVNRAKEKNYRYIAITDHVDYSNIDFVIEGLLRASDKIMKIDDTVGVIPGVELTHIYPDDIEEFAQYAKDRGARFVVVHGESVYEPVIKGTNKAAILAAAKKKKLVHILAHPGLISEEDAKLAAESDILLEITSRYPYCLCNGHVARLAQTYKAKLVFNTDAHRIVELLSEKQAGIVIRGAGVSNPQEVFKNAYESIKDIV